MTIRDIPLEDDYIINGKSAIEWVMERQAVTTQKELHRQRRQPLGESSQSTSKP